MNLLTETIEVLKYYGKTLDNVVTFCGDDFQFTREEFEKLANKDYDNGYGGQEVALDLKLVGAGASWWLERHEYDGAEEWHYVEPPDCNKPFKPIKTLMVRHGQDSNDLCWSSLAELNSQEAFMIYFLDTSAILNGALKVFFEDIYISPLVLQELESIKFSGKSEHIKYLAREAVRSIMDDKQTILSRSLSQYSYRKINRKLKKYPFLQDINDHRMIIEALLLEDSLDSITFVTSDALQFMYAKQLLPRPPRFFEHENEVHEPEYFGWRDYHPNTEEMSLLYTNPEMNILKAQTNEFCKIYDGVELKDVLFWDGEKYKNLKYKDIKNPYTGEVIKPRNLEQKFAFHILQDQDIKIKLLMSSWGSGKTMMALNYALEQVSKGVYDRIVFVRNNIIAAGTKDIGFIPGDVNQKLALFSRCIADHVGGEYELEKLIEEGIIETVPLSHIRGRSLHSSIVICDECENMTDTLMTLLISRIEESSEIIFCGDIAQIDSPVFKRNNGIKALLHGLVGDKLFAAVKLVKSERSRVARLCDKIIPPR